MPSEDTSPQKPAIAGTRIYDITKEGEDSGIRHLVDEGSNFPGAIHVDTSGMRPSSDDPLAHAPTPQQSALYETEQRAHDEQPQDAPQSDSHERPLHEPWTPWGKAKQLVSELLHTADGMSDEELSKYDDRILSKLQRAAADMSTERSILLSQRLADLRAKNRK